MRLEVQCVILFTLFHTRNDYYYNHEWHIVGRFVYRISKSLSIRLEGYSVAYASNWEYAYQNGPRQYGEIKRNKASTTTVFRRSKPKSWYYPMAVDCMAKRERTTRLLFDFSFHTTVHTRSMFGWNCVQNKSMTANAFAGVFFILLAFFSFC